MPARVTSRPGPLGEPLFRRFLVGYVASALGTAMAPIALVFALLGQGRSAAQVGQVLAVYALAFAASLLAGGIAADRFGRRAMMIAGELLGAASQLPLAVAVLTGHPPLWVFMVLLAAEGSGQALYGPALTGLIPKLAEGAGLQRANALVGTAASAGAIAGPAAAGLIAAQLGPGWAILANGLSYLASAATLTRLPVPGPAGPGESTLTQLRAGWQIFRSLGWLWPVTLYDAIGCLLVSAPFEVLGAVVAKSSLGGSSAWGTILAGQGVGALLGGLAAMRIKASRPLLVAMSCRLAFLAPLLLLIIRAPVAVILLGACISGVGIEVFFTLWTTTMQRLVPEESLSRVTSFDWLGVTALAPVGYAMVGVLAAGLGVNGTLWVSSAVLALLSVAVMSLPAVRGVMTPREQPASSAGDLPRGAGELPA